MRIKAWFHDVFVEGGWFQRLYFWTMAPLAVLGGLAGRIPYLAAHLPLYIRFAPLCAFLVGLVVCNVTAYSRAVARAELAEEKLNGISVDLVGCEARLRTQDELARVSIGLRLRARNHSDMPCGLELVACTSDLRPLQSECDDFGFDGKADATGHRDSACKALNAGGIHTFTVRAYYNFADKNDVLSVDRLSGFLTLKDNREELKKVPFWAVLERTETIRRQQAHVRAPGADPGDDQG